MRREPRLRGIAAPCPAEPEPALGPVITAQGVHFHVFSTAERVELVLFDRIDDACPARVLELERQPHSCSPPGG